MNPNQGPQLVKVDREKWNVDFIRGPFRYGDLDELGWLVQWKEVRKGGPEYRALSKIRKTSFFLIRVLNSFERD